MTDRGIRELEREAALGDPQAAVAFAQALQRSQAFVPCMKCGRFFPACAEHECDENGDPISPVYYPHRPGGSVGQVRRELIFDSEYVDFRAAQTSFFVNFHMFNTYIEGSRPKYWGVDTNLQGTQGLPAGHSFHALRIAALLPAGLEEGRRDWLFNNSFLQIRSASTEFQTVPGLLCFRDESSDAEEWVVQIAGGPPEDVPFEKRRGNEGIRGVDLTVNGVGLVFKGLEAYRVILGHPGGHDLEFAPVLVRVVMAGFMVRDWT